MTRDIVDINDFIVLFEHSIAGETTIDLCNFNDDVVGLSFYGSGDVRLTATFKDRSQVEAHTKGLAMSFFANGNVDFQHEVSGEVPLQCVVIGISLKNIRKLPSEEAQIFEEYLHDLIHPTGDFVSGPSFLMNGDMMHAVEKIFHTNYTGNMRIMFLRSQVTELLSHFFSLLSSSGQPGVDDDERKKLFEARTILTENLETPPSLNELSRLIGLNSYKLKKNFKELFGMPVFKFLQNERLDKANELLRQQQMSIQEVAWTVGYESISSFSNAFHKKFGFRPSAVKQ